MSGNGKAPTEGLILYWSSVSGNVASEKNTDRVRFLLSAAKLPFKELDLSLEENTASKVYMHEHSKCENKQTLPQVFKDGEYKGTAADIDEWNEFGELKMNLGVQ